MGKSYGDAAILNNGTIIDLSKFNSIKLDQKEKTITVGAGLSFNEILNYIVPKGYFLPVLAGTSLITVGGAIASDIHGKNHSNKGSIGNNIKSITIINGKSEIKNLSPYSNSELKELFWATVGGMGLTGIIIKAKISLIEISNSFMNVKIKKHLELDHIIESMNNEIKNHEYNVAWIDSQSIKGRGISQHANHLKNQNSNKLFKPNQLNYENPYIINFPKFLNINLVHKYSVGMMNKIWFHKLLPRNKNEIQKISKFFFPLDSIRNWNLAYGEKGFLQYQFLVPEKRLIF